MHKKNPVLVTSNQFSLLDKVDEDGQPIEAKLNQATSSDKECLARISNEQVCLKNNQEGNKDIDETAEGYKKYQKWM